MDKINFRFLNYKHYASFKAALDDNRISTDSIVFIQDKPCIWARGKEYVCDGPTTTSTEGQSLKFKNGSDSVIFTVNVNEGTLTFTDQNGNILSNTYALSSELQSIANALTKDLINAEKEHDEDIAAVRKWMQEEIDALSAWIATKADMIEGENPPEDYESLYNYINKNFQLKGDYALNGYVNQTFVKKPEVYTPKQGAWGSDGNISDSSSSVINIPTASANITVDTNLDATSANPVENRAIKLWLDTKANVSDLNIYATKAQLQDKANRSELSNYATQQDIQDLYTAGDGISIVGNVISTTIDTNMWIIVDELPQEDIDPNKIYLLEESQNGDTIYTEYRYKNGQWVPSGQRMPEVDLTGYLTTDAAANNYLSKHEAANTYQLAGNYADADEVAQTYQPIGDYVTDSALDIFRLYVDNTFQRKGGYATAVDVSNALTTLQSIIDQKYVLKKDVYRPESNQWSTSSPSQINIASSTGGDSSQGGSSSGGGASANMITLTVTQYEALVANNLVNENTYYFTYEEEETTTWGFGDKFPVILTDGSTPDSIGTFPITLS